MTFKEWAIDTGERALSTYVQTLITFTLGVTALDASVLQAMAIAALPAGINVIYQALLGWNPSVVRSWWLDTLIRTVRTFAFTALGLMSADAFDFTDIDAYQAVGRAGFAAALVVVKTSFAFFRKGTITPASLVKAP